MRQNVRRWLFSVGAVAAVGAFAAGQGIADAAPAAATRTAATSQAAAAYKPPSKPLYYGETGAAVKSVQRRLNQLHYYAGPDDGNYGYDVLEAAYAFREAQGLAMNVTTGAEPITRAFERDLVHPRQPYVLIKHGAAERVEINLKRQLLVLYKHDKVDLILHISSGGGYQFCDPAPPKGDGQCTTAVTPDGNFHAVYMVHGLDIVPLGSMYNPVFFDPAAGDAMHGGDPDDWYPASHGCVRLPEDVQNWFWKLLTIGGKHATPVYLRGTAPYQPSIVG
jgi:peptidoglycan hydrolase-like protein with peptidoglycan-binding domain